MRWARSTRTAPPTSSTSVMKPPWKSTPEASVSGSPIASMTYGGWSATPQQTVDVTLLGRFYERFGDHGVSIARRIVFLVTGDLSAGEPLHIHG